MSLKRRRKGKNGQIYWVKESKDQDAIEICWADIFEHISPTFIGGASEYWYINELNDLISYYALEELEKKHPNKKFDDIKIFKQNFQEIRIQFRALGYLGFNKGDWYLTKLGDGYMNSPCRNKTGQCQRFLTKPSKRLLSAALESRRWLSCHVAEMVRI